MPFLSKKDWNKLHLLKGNRLFLQIRKTYTQTNQGLTEDFWPKINGKNVYYNETYWYNDKKFANITVILNC